MNVDLLEQMLNDLLPSAEDREGGPYSYVLAKLFHFGITSQEELNSLIRKHLAKAMSEDSETAARGLKRIDAGNLPNTNRDRLVKGLYFSKAALLNRILRLEFGDERWREYEWKDFKAEDAS